MKRLKIYLLGMIVLAVSLGTTTWAQVSEDYIPLDDIRLPADDLLLPTGERLTPEELWQLRSDASSDYARLDLSRIDPVSNEIWDSQVTPQNDDLAISSDSRLIFMGAKASASGMFRFNVKDESASQIYTLALDKTLHTVLLRRSFLRKLGYKVPSMEWLSKVSVEFDSLEDLNRFKDKLIPEATLGAPSRWVDAVDEAQLKITLKDVAALRPDLSDHYNVALGVPPKALSSRTLRSLLLPYALLNIRESVNKLKWHEGRIDNQVIKLPHFTQANFNATIDDAKWILRRMNRLTREDIASSVREANYPKEVELLLVEKIISRRNSLNALFKIIKPDTPFNAEISYGEDLVKGEIKKNEWAGYASNFAHPYPDSPFEDRGYTILSELQSIGIDELVARANEHLEAFDLSMARAEFHQEQFKEGLEHFIETGEFKDFGIGTWVSPVLNGNAIVSRNVVVGQYMGTDNLVQLADTFGFAVTIGAHVGIENLGPAYSAYARGTLSYLKTYTHLKPVKSLKESIKEPYRNMVVPLLKSKLAKALEGIGSTLSSDGEPSEEDKKKIEEFYDVLGKYLGVGESLIITEKMTPTALLSGSTTMAQTRFTLSLSSDYLTMRRIHLNRESSDIIQVYMDNGNALGVQVSASLDHLIPVARLTFRRDDGKYKVAFNKVNINIDPEENPDLKSNAIALAQILRDGSAEALHAFNPPYVISQDYVDWNSKFKFLAWRMKTVDGSGVLKVQAPSGHVDQFLSLSDATQSGINYEDFARDVANYYLKKLWTDPRDAIQIGTNPWKNPSQSILGLSETRTSKFEARWDESSESYTRPFIGLTRQLQGWSASKKKLQSKLAEINEKFNTVLFPRNVLEDVEKLKLYDISVNVNFYQRGVEKLKNLDLKEVERAFSSSHRRGSTACNSRIGNNRLMNCFRSGGMDYSNLIASQSNECKVQASRAKAKKEAKCLMELATLLLDHVPFKNFKKIIGEDNFYLYGVVSGFRSKSEILYEPETSNSVGRITDRAWNGPLAAVRELIGMQDGEMNGYWIRERL